MTDKIKAVLYSEKGMTIVNLLFILSILIRNRGIIFFAYTMWIIYLICSIKITTSKTVRVVNGLFITFAVIMIVLNLYLMIKQF